MFNQLIANLREYLEQYEFDFISIADPVTDRFEKQTLINVHILNRVNKEEPYMAEYLPPFVAPRFSYPYHQGEYKPCTLQDHWGTPTVSHFNGFYEVIEKDGFVALRGIDLSGKDLFLVLEHRQTLCGTGTIPRLVPLSQLKERVERDRQELVEAFEDEGLLPFEDRIQPVPEYLQVRIARYETAHKTVQTFEEAL